MRSVMIVHDSFDNTWPFAADHFRALWEKQGPVEFERRNDQICPPLGRHNVVHTPHTAGRTRHSNEQWAAELAEQFLPVAN